MPTLSNITSRIFSRVFSRLLARLFSALATFIAIAATAATGDAHAQTRPDVGNPDSAVQHAVPYPNRSHPNPPRPNRPRTTNPTSETQRIARAQIAPILPPNYAPPLHLNPSPLPPIPSSAFNVRIKDITTIEGHRSNRVEGFGLVTGLKGTGGKGAITQQFAKTMLQNQGILIDKVPTKSLSVVSVSAEIPPFYKPGETLTATVAVLDDAQSLYGGQLLRTPLIAIDGQTYALAGGALEIGGFSASGAGGSVKKNHDTVGKVQAQLEVEICNGPPFNGTNFRLLLKNKDYTTAYRIANEINQYFPRAAQANDAGSVDVLIPRTFTRSPMDFLVMINNLRVEPDIPARVVINEKTGTIVVGKNVKLSSIVFAKDNLIITTSETPVASQPAPLSGGATVVLPRTQIQATEQGGRYNTLAANATVGDLANALNMLGVTPQDLISVFQSIKAEGSLQATLIVE